MKGILCFACLLVLGVVLCTFPSAAPAADLADALPARVETADFHPPAPQIDLDATGVKNFRVAAAAALPGRPLERAATAARAVGRARPLRFLFRGRAGRGCG